MADVAVAGTGRLGRNVGAHMLRLGHRVTWLAEDDVRAREMERHAGKLARRVERAASGAVRAATDVRLSAGVRLPLTEVLIECITEDLEAKRALFEAIEPALGDDALLLSNSSSILPADLHPRCVGVHFFYPVELSCVVELIPGTDEGAARRAEDFARGCGLSVVREDGRSAFTANRLLLPVQAELLRALAAGADPAVLDSVPAGGMLPAGQLRLMDAVGLDVIREAVGNYLHRMAPREAGPYAGLLDALSLLVEAGKLGAKNGDGLLLGAPLPWPRAPRATPDPDALGTTLRALFVNTCLRLSADGAVPPSDLDLLTGKALQMEISLREEIAALGRERAADILRKAYHLTGLAYFEPFSLLT